jgi:hypothetical protein
MSGEGEGEEGFKSLSRSTLTVCLFVMFISFLILSSSGGEKERERGREGVAGGES